MKDYSMKEYTVTYFLTKEQERLLQEVTAMYNKISKETENREITPEHHFALLMLIGSDKIIDNNLAFVKTQLEANS